MPDETILEKIMRFSPAGIALSACLAIMSSASLSKLPDHQIDPRSVELAGKADAAVKAGNQEEAIDWLETALAVDPRNREAYISLARVMHTQGLNGKSIRFYKEALELDPNDRTALSEQTDVMIAKGALEAARNNVARLRAICRGACEEADRLALALDDAGKKPVMQASAVEINPVATSENDGEN